MVTINRPVEGTRATPILNINDLVSEVHGGQGVSITPGTAVAIGTAHCIAVVVKGLTSNAGIVYVGDSTMKKNGYELNAKESVALGIGFLGSVFVDVANSGEGISYLYIK